MTDNIIQDHEIGDIVDFLSSEMIFRPNQNEVKPWMDLIDSYDQAFEFSTIQYEDKIEPWGDLAENELGDVMGDYWVAANYKQKDRAFSKLVEPIMNRLEFLLAKKGKISDEIRTAADADLHMILKARFFGGQKSSSFLEKLFQGYKTGGWPCGWIGNYPEGKMVIYMPAPKKE